MSESNPEVLKAVRLLVGDLVNKERYVMLPAEPGEGDPVLGKFRTVSDAKRFASRSDITEFSLWTRLKVVGGGSLKEDFKDSDGIDVDWCVGDVRDPEGIKKSFDQLAKKIGGIDILVCNAAGNFICPTEELSWNGWRTVIEIDLNGTFNCCQAALPHLKESSAHQVRGPRGAEPLGGRRRERDEERGARVGRARGVEVGRLRREEEVAPGERERRHAVQPRPTRRRSLRAGCRRAS